MLVCRRKCYKAPRVASSRGRQASGGFRPLSPPRVFPSSDPRRKPSHKSHKSIRQSTRGPAVFSYPPRDRSPSHESRPALARFRGTLHPSLSHLILLAPMRTSPTHTHTHTHLSLSLSLPTCTLAFPLGIATCLGTLPPNSALHYSCACVE